MPFWNAKITGCGNKEIFISLCESCQKYLFSSVVNVHFHHHNFGKNNNKGIVGIMVEVNKPLLRHLAYLYLSFAHLTDAELSDEELQVSKERLKKYASPEIDIEKLMLEVIHWYNSSVETRLQVINSIAVTFHFEMKDQEFKKSILRDLVSIAKADKKFLPAERQFIEVISKAWNIDFTIRED